MLNLKSFEDFNESFWGDVHKRSRGDEIRKEDDVDLMDEGNFWHYLNMKYKHNGKTEVILTTGTEKDRLTIPIEKWIDDGVKYSYELGFNYNGHGTPTYDLIDKYNMRIYKCFKQTRPYYAKEYEENDAFFKEYVDASKIFGDEYIVDKNEIIPQNGELENHHIIDILDKCLSIVKNPYVKKIKNPKYYKE